ncbi:hypothetical protein P4B35_08405 [Pontiellaceae bacterium B12227]|nr:hypothetical protein [Pontiellaceae bacterium B12227]
MRKLLAILLGLGMLSASYGATTFHSDFDEADLGSIVGLTVDTPSTNGADSGTVTLDTTDDQLDLTANGANMWTARQGAPIAWVSAPTVVEGDTWYVETQVNMVESGGTSDRAGWEQAGITFYDGTAGANPGAEAAPFLCLNDWNAWNVNAQDFTIGSGNNTTSPDLGSATFVYLRVEITEGGATDTYNFFYKLNAGDAWTQLTGWALDHTSDAPNSAVGLFLKSHDNNTSAAAQFDYLTVGTIDVPGASLTFSPTSLSLDLLAPDTTVDGAITASYFAGSVTSNDITIASATADAGFTAVMTDPILGNSDTEEVITVTFDNSGIGLTNGESTNSTLEIIWQELGGVVNTSSIPLDVTYINEPNGFELAPSSLSLTLNSPDTSTNGTIVASYIEGTIPANIEIVSVVTTNGFSVDPDSFTLGTANDSENILVTYANTGALVNHGDTAESVVVITYTETGSGVTNTANGSVDVFYYNPTISTTVIAGYDFDDGTGTGTTNVTLTDVNVTASGFGTGTGVVSVVNSNNANCNYSELDAEYNLFGTANGFEFGGASSAWLYTLMNNQDDLGLAMTNADYMVFTVTPTNGYAMDLTSFTFRSRINQLVSSAERWALFSSVGGFDSTTNAIATGRTTQIGTWDGASNNNVVDLSAVEFQELDEAVEFRLYIYGGSTGYSSATLFDKVIVNGDVYGLALPPVSASVSGGALIMSWEDGRAYNVLTNNNLQHGEWEVSESGMDSPVTNSIGDEPQLFYKLGK